MKYNRYAIFNCYTGEKLGTAPNLKGAQKMHKHFTDKYNSPICRQCRGPQFVMVGIPITGAVHIGCCSILTSAHVNNEV